MSERPVTEGNRSYKAAEVRFYFDADILGLAHCHRATALGCHLPRRPRRGRGKRARPPCPIASTAVKDSEWIPEVARRGWLIITRDSHIQDHRAEIEAVLNLPIDAITAALHAEGCLELDQPGSTSPLNEHPLFQEASPLFPLLPEGWPRYRPGQFPTAERLHRSTLKITVPHSDDDLADGYVGAFEKVLSNHRFLLEDQPA